MNLTNDEVYLKFMFYDERLPENRIMSIQSNELKQIKSEIFLKFGISSDLSFYNKYGIQIFDDYLPLSEEYFYYIQESSQDFNVQILLEDYKLIKLLGQGGYGKVVQAKHFFDGKILAIKIVNYSNVLTSISINSFKEALIIKGLSHPNIIHLYNALMKNGILYLLMEYIYNGSLAQFLNFFNYDGDPQYFNLNSTLSTYPKKTISSENVSRFRNNENESKLYGGKHSPILSFGNVLKATREEIVRKIFRQIIDVISYCHERQIAHRDLKLENIMISDQSNLTIKVIDFGIASIGNEFSNAGTIRYLAPEVF